MAGGGEMSAHPHKVIIEQWIADTSLEIERKSLCTDGVWFSSSVVEILACDEQTFRIKPKTRSVTVDGVLYEWPEPMRVAPECGTTYWAISTYPNRVCESSWTHHEYDKEVLKIGFMQATKEGAEAHRRALIAVSGGTLE